MPKFLIVNADDYGRTPGISAGIRQAHLDGIVTSTTVMMNLPHAADAVRQALSECPQLGLGVHLVLTYGQPVLPASQVPSLTAGGPRFPGLPVQAPRLAELDIVQVQREWRAQVERFMSAAARPPDHLDSHHHFSYYTPELFQAMLDLASDLGCPVRAAASPLPGEAIGGFPEGIAKQAAAFIPGLLLASRVPHADYFSASFYGENCTRANLENILASLPEGITELMAHPGYAYDLSDSTYAAQREVELALLTGPDLRQVVDAYGVKLISFSGLH